jgi:hypothetical protein
MNQFIRPQNRTGQFPNHDPSSHPSTEPPTVAKNTRLCDPLLCLNTIRRTSSSAASFDAIEESRQVLHLSVRQGVEGIQRGVRITIMFAGVGQLGKPHLLLSLDHDLHSIPGLAACSAPFSGGAVREVWP